MRQAALCAVIAALAGCSLTPGAGPMASRIAGDATIKVGEKDADEAYAYFNMSQSIARQVNATMRPAAPSAGIAGTPFADHAKPPRYVLGTDDLLDISIISVDTTGFVDFSQSAISPLSRTDLPRQRVASDGRVQVPPLGRVSAKGITPQTLEARLSEQLSGVLVDPKAVVQVVESRSRRAAVLGRVHDSRMVTLGENGLRLLDAITEAGGPTAEPRDVIVALSRNGRQGRVQMDQVLRDDSLNVTLWPGDVVELVLERPTYTAVGGVRENGTYTFDTARLTLAEALGSASALTSEKGSRNGVFVYRLMSAISLREFDVDPAQFPDGMAPVVFSFDFTRPQTLFAAQIFEMRDGDVIYVSDSLFEEISKVLDVVTRIVSSSSVTGVAVKVGP